MTRPGPSVPGRPGYDRLVGLFDFLRGKDERAIPEPGTPEFEATVKGSALPDSQSVEMGEQGWASAGPGRVEVERSTHDLDLSDVGEAREKIIDALRQHGIDPDKPGQRVDANSVPGLRDAIIGALGEAGIPIPGAGGFGGGISVPEQDPLAVMEQLARARDAGEITDAEFEAQKRRLLGE